MEKRYVTTVPQSMSVYRLRELTLFRQRFPFSQRRTTILWPWLCPSDLNP